MHSSVKNRREAAQPFFFFPSSFRSTTGRLPEQNKILQRLKPGRSEESLCERAWFQPVFFSCFSSPRNACLGIAVWIWCMWAAWRPGADVTFIAAAVNFSLPLTKISFQSVKVDMYDKWDFWQTGSRTGAKSRGHEFRVQKTAHLLPDTFSSKHWQQTRL